MAIYKLPTFNGYTIDLRLEEFRKFEHGELPEYIHFDSDKGSHLFNAWVKEKPDQFVATVEHYLEEGTDLNFLCVLVALVVKAKEKAKKETRKQQCKQGCV